MASGSGLCLEFSIFCGEFIAPQWRSKFIVRFRWRFGGFPGGQWRSRTLQDVGKWWGEKVRKEKLERDRLKICFGWSWYPSPPTQNCVPSSVKLFHIRFRRIKTVIVGLSQWKISKDHVYHCGVWCGRSGGSLIAEERSEVVSGEVSCLKICG